ncbi:unnamed protein product [Cyprideis torosa]|uniref:Uncharacterized protein n=1 Tax=Cyprideis torosa TaxID=163714 RepID=A0A7R8W2K1_9CRUS|nr:unnamed protein product [Cyprideis torosa]CAG0881972.1 unnamed protein product [Cyprideis torosa]
MVARNFGHGPCVDSAGSDEPRMTEPSSFQLGGQWSDPVAMDDGSNTTPAPDMPRGTSTPLVPGPLRVALPPIASPAQAASDLDQGRPGDFQTAQAYLLDLSGTSACSECQPCASWGPSQGSPCPDCDPTATCTDCDLIIAHRGDPQPLQVLLQVPRELQGPRDPQGPLQTDFCDCCDDLSHGSAAESASLSDFFTDLDEDFCLECEAKDPERPQASSCSCEHLGDVLSSNGVSGEPLTERVREPRPSRGFQGRTSMKRMKRIKLRDPPAAADDGLPRSLDQSLPPARRALDQSLAPAVAALSPRESATAPRVPDERARRAAVPVASDELLDEFRIQCVMGRLQSPREASSSSAATGPSEDVSGPSGVNSEPVLQLGRRREAARSVEGNESSMASPRSDNLSQLSQEKGPNPKTEQGDKGDGAYRFSTLAVPIGWSTLRALQNQVALSQPVADKEPLELHELDVAKHWVAHFV